MSYKPICFVIMGFGKKSDPSTGKTFNLDQTYKNIIKPAVAACGYECVRADEIQDSGLIDKSMYALLIQADLVIADISTYNPNAIYELGIRHAVKPFSTIILKEKRSKKIFDLDHTRMFTYSHMGEDIGTDESKRCQELLTSLIEKVSKEKQTDSPLYEFIDITPPKLSDKEYQYIIDDLADREKHIFALAEKALMQMREKKFQEACISWEKASSMAPSEPYFIQQQALCRYKSELPSPGVAYTDALNIIGQLDLDGNTTDPETLGITGAIYKNLWVLHKDMEYLNRAITYYGKCFKIRNDYYTGENYAHCLNMKAMEEPDGDEKTYLRIEAKKTRQAIISYLLQDVDSDSFVQRTDKKWVYATLSQCYFGLADKEESEKYETLFLSQTDVPWEVETFTKTRNQLKEII